MFLGESANPLGSLVPTVPFVSYFLLIPVAKTGYTSGRFIVKKAILKKLVTFAEFLAQWS